MKVVYIAGPYRAKTERELVLNIRLAETAALRVWCAGAVALCPHMNTAFFGGAFGLPDEVWLKGDKELLERCDAVYVLRDWKKSEGTRREIEHAQEMGMFIFYQDIDENAFLKWVLDDQS